MSAQSPNNQPSIPRGGGDPAGALGVGGAGGAGERSLTDQLGEVRSQIEALRASAQPAAAPGPVGTLGGIAAHVAALEDQLSKRDQALRLLADRWKSAEARASESEARLERYRIEVERAGAARLLMRKVRLSRYRSMLSSRSRKLIQARQMLDMCAKQYEELLGQRSKVATAWSTVQELERRLRGRRARVGAVAWVCGVVVTMGVLSALAWGVAQQTAVPTYTARMMLAPDYALLPPDRKPDAAEIAEWGRSVREAVADAPFIELAAQRMDRRGLAALASPTDLRARLKDDLFIETDPSGQLIVEFRGPGSESTTRVLETLSAALVSYVNDARAKLSSLATIVTAAPIADARPTSDPRPLRAAMYLGCGLAGSLVMGLGAWRSLARLKRTFEHEQMIVETLDAQHWPDASKVSPRGPAPASASVAAGAPARPAVASDGRKPGVKTKARG